MGGRGRRKLCRNGWGTSSTRGGGNAGSLEVGGVGWGGEGQGFRRSTSRTAEAQMDVKVEIRCSTLGNGECMVSAWVLRLHY